MIAQHGIQGGDHLAHNSHNDDLGLLIGSRKTLVKGFESGVVSACAEGRHIKDVADRHAATIDAAMATELAAVEVVGRDPDESSDLLSAHSPEFWQKGDECKGQDRTDTRHRDQDLIAFSQASIVREQFAQAVIEKSDIGLETSQPPFMRRRSMTSSI